MFIDEEDNYVIRTPKTEIIEDVVPPVKLVPVISQETVKLPKPIPKTDLPENIDYVSAISDINKITRPNQFDNVDGDIDFNIVEQTPDDDDGVTRNLCKIHSSATKSACSPPIHPRERLKKNETNKNEKRKV